MKGNTPHISIGTSGWAYPQWHTIFYPPAYTYKKLLFYSQQYNTVEVNSSFYRIPTAATFTAWHDTTPANFTFSIKLYREITHTKKLILDTQCIQLLEAFIGNAQHLKNKLAAILIQLPPSLANDIERLTLFTTQCHQLLQKHTLNTALAFEFRHPSWFNEQTYGVLKEYASSLVINNSSVYPSAWEFPASITYIRLHGPQELYASCYTQEELDALAEKIKHLPTTVKQVFIYFNNTVHEHALTNARYLYNQLMR